MVRLWVAAAVLCGWFSVCGVASAQEYVQVSKDSDGGSYFIDSQSIRVEGGLAYVWAKIELTNDRSVPGEMFRHWHRSIVRMVDNCQTHLFAVQSWTYYDVDGKSVKTLNYPGLAFKDAPPGSAESRLLDAGCRMADQMRATKRHLNFGPESNIPWAHFGGSSATHVDYFWDPADVDAVTEGMRGIRVKVTTLITPQSPASTYPTAYSIVLVNCEQNSFLFYTSDYYNSVGALVHSEVVDRSTARFSAAQPATMGMSLVTRACAAQAKAVQGGGGSSSGKGKGQIEAGSGTGWMGPKGYLLTAEHVVHGAERILLYQEGQMVGTAEVVVTDEANDVAVLRPHFKTLHPPSLALRHHSALIGEHIFTLGFPAPQLLGADLKMTSGEVSATSAEGGDRRALQISVPVQPGNSGGPVMDDNGEVVGVVVRGMDAIGDHIAQNVNYAVKETYLEPLIEDLPDMGSHTQSQQSGKMTDLVAAKRSSVFLVYVEGHHRD